MFLNVVYWWETCYFVDCYNECVTGVVLTNRIPGQSLDVFTIDTERQWYTGGVRTFNEQNIGIPSVGNYFKKFWFRINDSHDECKTKDHSHISIHFLAFIHNQK